jgi:hypothetical protein
VNKRFFTLFFCLFCILSPVLAGNTHEEIKWKENTQELKSQSTSFENNTFENALFLEENENIPLYVKTIKINEGNNRDISIVNPFFETTNIVFSEQMKSKIGKDIKISSYIGYEKKQAVLTFSFLPFRINEKGIIEKLVHFDIESNEIGNSSENRIINNKTYVTESALANGDWYKFGVTQSGLYKLDYDFLKSLGMNVDNINPNNLKIYGQMGGMLPNLAGSATIDDIQEFGIKVVTANNTTFSQGDYILFYAPGPEKWTYNPSTKTYKHQVNMFSNTKNFFITIGSGNGKRIGIASLSNDPETTTLTNYDDFSFIEQEIVNIGKSGNKWFGDEFGFQETRDYAFNFTDIDQSVPAKLSVSFAAKSNNFTTTFSLLNNNSTIGTYNVGPIGNSDLADYGRSSSGSAIINNPSENIALKLTYSRPDFDSKGWLDFLAIQVKRNLTYRGTPLTFRGAKSTNGATTKFNLSGLNNNVEIWDITDVFNAKKVTTTNNAFKVVIDSLNEYVAFENTTLKPIGFGKINNQNLHGIGQKELIIVTRNSLLTPAQELANFHAQKQGLSTLVVDIDQIFNEFSSGNNDVTAIRNFVKMIYDRAGNDPSLMPKYLILFGDGSYNNRNLGEYLLPTYQSPFSLELLRTYTSDDYFGLLDDNEGANIDNTTTEKMDIAIGRIPADNLEKAQIAVEKIKRYMSADGFGDWRNTITFIADDEDGILHVDAADGFAEKVKNDSKGINIDKIYLDAFVQSAGAGGSAYPDVNDAINKSMFKGSLIMNYVGHGGVFGWSKERVLTFDDINKWENKDKLPLFITATCEFGPYDQEGEFTAGERVYFSKNGGAIALVTTVRLVYSDRNEEINKNFLNKIFEAESEGEVVLGDVLLKAKNISNTGDGNRKFTLLGDPALVLGFPKQKIVTTEINNISLPSEDLDTIKALSLVKINGEIHDRSDNLLNGFNGDLAIKVFDKSKKIETLENDPDSGPFTFNLQKNVLFNGRTNVVNGTFEVTFLAPKDMEYTYGKGKISYYAQNENEDAGGFFDEITIGGIADTLISDNEGPEIDLFLGDRAFIEGGLTNDEPKLIADLSDENGINTSGNGIGHDITVILDDNTKNTIILNDFYQGGLGDFTQGEILYPFSKLSSGRHTITLKAWDNLNNSGKASTEFFVAESAELALNNILNYPNPFSSLTHFAFEHNKPGDGLVIKIEIYSIAGRLVKTIEAVDNGVGNRFDNIEWDGLDDFGDPLGNGMYVYRLSVRDSSGKIVEKTQKLVILN